MRVAAIVVAYNSARDLPASLGCLSELELDRVVAVDNSSTDDSAGVARAYTPHVLSLPNAGFGAAVNAAAARAPDVEAYLLLNPDCRISGKDFALLVDALRDDARLGAVAPLMRYPDGRYGISAGPEPSMAKEWLAALRFDHLVPKGVKSRLSRSAPLRARLRMLEYLAVEPAPGESRGRAHRRQKPAPAALARTRTVAWVSGFCMLVRAAAFREVGGFDPRFFLYFEDVDICRRLREGGWRIASVGASVADHEESTSTAAVGKRRLYRAGMRVYFSLHGTRGQRLLARALSRSPI